MRGSVLLFSTLLLGCGGGDKKAPKKPTSKKEVQEEKETKETDADREKKRRKLAAAIVPEGSSCLPASLKEDNAPRLELAAIGKDAVVCAADTDRDRLLGMVACWKVDLSTGKLEYKEPEPLPGRGYSVMLEGGCARGYCLPKKPDGVAHVAKNLDGTKAAVLFGDEVHLFNGESKDHESSFTIRGDKGLTNDPKAVHFVGDTILVEGIDQGPYSAVWVFKADGTQVGAITTLGGKEEKPISTYHGSFSILDKTRVGVAEKGMETLTTYDVTSGARAKLVRKVPKLSCKPAELDAYWVDGDKVSDKCKDSIKKASGHLKGATVVAGAKNFLVLLRGDRLGELAVLDAKSLAEKTVIKMPWCEGDGGGGGDKKEADKADAEKPAEEKAADKPKKGATRGAVPKGDSADPQEGGE